jgi:basic amino acid/polyamine antiporter, APA family
MAGSPLFRTRSIDKLIAAGEAQGRQLNRTLGLWSLVALGIGAVIGSGIFILTGTAAAGQQMSVPSVLYAPLLDLILQGPAASYGRPGAGPAIIISFLLVALACGLAGLCYAELASMIPASGSAYTYAYATLGELVAWIIGWDLILEYAVSNMAVAVGFTAYLNALLQAVFGWRIPDAFSQPIIVGGQQSGAIFNFPALIIMMLLSWLLVRGVKESATANNLMVLVKVAAILAFVFGAASAINPLNYDPFAPNGFRGVLSGAAIVFFTYIGFDSVSTAGEECRNPKRDLPLGILLTLVACTLLYGSVALVLTGIARYDTLNNSAPVATALQSIGRNYLNVAVSAGAIWGMLSSLLVFQYGQTRVWFAMSRDKLLPPAFSAVHPRFRTPHISTWIAGLAVGIPAGIWDIGAFADVANIGTLFAFLIVSVAVLVLRRTQPDRPRPFRVPLAPVLPVLSILCCLLLMTGLPLLTWIWFFGWLAVGLVIYFAYSKPRIDAAGFEG